MAKVTNNDKKDQQLGMSHGTATHQLRKKIMFRLMQKCGEDICFQCGQKIESIDELSIEHKIPWLDSGSPDLFWDLDNIAFSHLSCNFSARRDRPRTSSHGSSAQYNNHGCRCETCKDGHAERRRIQRLRTITLNGKEP